MVEVLPLFVFRTLAVIGAELDEDNIRLIGEGVFILLGLGPCGGRLGNHRPSTEPEVLHLKVIAKKFLQLGGIAERCRDPRFPSRR